MPVTPGTTAHQQIADAVGDALPSMGQVLNTLRDNLDRIADQHGLDRYEVKALVRENWGITFPPRNEDDRSNIPVAGPAYDLPEGCRFQVRNNAATETTHVGIWTRPFRTGPFRWYQLLQPLLPALPFWPVLLPIFLAGGQRIAAETFSTSALPIEQTRQRLEIAKNRLAGIALAAARVNKAGRTDVADILGPLGVPDLPDGHRFFVSWPSSLEQERMPVELQVRVSGTKLRKGCGTPQLHELPATLHEAMTDLAVHAHKAALR